MQRHLDFGGTGLLLHLATANGFPPEAYRPLAATLTPRYRMVGYRARPLWPASRPDEIRCWHDLAADMLADIDRLTDEPLVGIGHSLGGIMTLYAALWRPERFRAVVLIDPVFLPRPILPLIWFARQIGQHHQSPLARGAARRRDRFASVDEARTRYDGRGLFKDFVSAALDGYLEGGLRPTADGGVTLAWSREWESRIFSLVPIDPWHAATKLRAKTLLIRGRYSDLMIDRSWQQMAGRFPDAILHELEGGHMVPMERPQEVAGVIETFLANAVIHLDS